MTEEVFDLDRERNIEALVDSFGKQWKIVASKQTGLCYARPNPDREDAKIPKILEGLWTKASLLKPLITKYVTSTWDAADRADVKSERKRQVALEAAKGKKDVKVVNVKRAASD